MTDVAVIIVSWNSREDLLRCLPSLERSAQRYSIETFLVDNASSDDSAAVGRSLLPSLTLIQNARNDGFAAANNLALRRVKARHALLLNADTELRSGAVDSLVSFMDAHPTAWACGPGMLNGDGTAQRTGVRFPNTWNLLVEALFLDRLFPQSRLFGRHRELYESPSDVREVDYVQGSCLMIRSSALATVGLLDESFYMYFEETDWCLRAKRAGGKIFLVPHSEVTHFGGGVEGHYDERRLIHYHQSLLRFYRKHYSMPSQGLLRMVLLVRSVLRILIWGLIAMKGGEKRKMALSAASGYLHVFPILLQRG